MELETFKTLAEAGTIGLALALIGLIVFIIKTFMKHLNNHSKHQTDAIYENTKVTGELKGAIKELAIYVKSLNGKK